MQAGNYDLKMTQLLEQLPKGAFLTVQDRTGRVNTMTIGWGATGIIWSKPALMVMVRKSRYTYQLINEADSFTVSLPLQNQLKRELGLFGTKSGRDYDKYKEFGLVTRPGKETTSPVIEGCDLYCECHILYQQPMDSQQLSGVVRDKWYGDDDYHTLYYGEIVAFYRRED
ncbi:MAG: flavin reductase family protein [Methanomassiliicoccales archaeon]